MSEKKIKVGITYCWDSKEHQEKVINLCNTLRSEKGYDASMDKMLSQKESAINFHKMMHTLLNDNDKVIIVLSKGYKDKAESFKGGVGNEYESVLSEIHDNPNKYILFTFDSYDKEIIPFGFSGRELIFNNDIEKLCHKITETPEILFSEMNAETYIPLQKKITIKEEGVKTPYFIIEDVQFKNVGSIAQGGKYSYIEYEVTPFIKYIGKETIKDIRIEISIPKLLVKINDYKNFSLTNDPMVLLYSKDFNTRIFPNQQIETSSFNLTITRDFYQMCKDSKITVKIYSDFDLVEESILIIEKLFIPNNNNNNEHLSIDNFKLY